MTVTVYSLFPLPEARYAACWMLTAPESLAPQGVFVHILINDIIMTPRDAEATLPVYLLVPVLPYRYYYTYDT